MKIAKHYNISPQMIGEFIKLCRDAKLDFTTTWKSEIMLFDCTIITNEGYYEKVMSDLLSIKEEFNLSFDQEDAINTALASIKTLSDMGVIE